MQTSLTAQANLTRFDRALQFTLAWEGKYSDNPHDPGAATNFGITQATYDAWNTEHALMLGPVSGLTQSEARSIYFVNYWSAAHCPEIGWPLDACHFDWAVNHGVSGAIRTLQRVIGVTQDGVWGPETASALESEKDTLAELAWQYNSDRLQVYEEIVRADPSLQIFMQGWENRVEALDRYTGVN